MPEKLIECVPNFSEGCDGQVVEAIESAIGAVRGITVLGRESDPDHNRSVITFAGPPGAVAEAALNGAGEAVKRIDLGRHIGVHPRIGALDVLPFVPVRGVTLQECARLAWQVGGEIWERFKVPVYFYEAAARRDDRRNLADVRRGQLEELRQKAESCPDRFPDVGGPGLHPTAGATAVGARRFLIAYNVNLATRDVRIARRIAGKIRQASGGFPHVKALGLELGSRKLVQVSMNLTDFEATPVDCVFETIENEAARCEVKIESCEIVGLIPELAFRMAPDFYRRAANFHLGLILENRLAALKSE